MKVEPASIFLQSFFIEKKTWKGLKYPFNCKKIQHKRNPYPQDQLLVPAIKAANWTIFLLLVTSLAKFTLIPLRPRCDSHRISFEQRESVLRRWLRLSPSGSYWNLKLIKCPVGKGGSSQSVTPRPGELFFERLQAWTWQWPRMECPWNGILIYLLTARPNHAKCPAPEQPEWR